MRCVKRFFHGYLLENTWQDDLSSELPTQCKLEYVSITRNTTLLSRQPGVLLIKAFIAAIYVTGILRLTVPEFTISLC